MAPQKRRNKATTTLIPSPTQRQDGPRAYKNADTDKQRNMNEVTNDGGASAGLPPDIPIVAVTVTDTTSQLATVNETVDVTGVPADLPANDSSITQPLPNEPVATAELSFANSLFHIGNNHITPQASPRHSRSSLSFLRSIRRRRKSLFDARDRDTIKLSTESRLRNLQYWNSRLELKLMSLEVAVSKCSRLEARIAELEKTIADMSKPIPEDRDNTVSCEVALPNVLCDEVVTTPLSPVDDATMQYPPPNEPTSDGMWYTIGSTRYWVRSKQELIRLKKRRRKAERRRETRRRKSERRASKRTANSFDSSSQRRRAENHSEWQSSHLRCPSQLSNREQQRRDYSRSDHEVQANDRIDGITTDTHVPATGMDSNCPATSSTSPSPGTLLDNSHIAADRPLATDSSASGAGVWIYASGFSNTTSAEEIRKYVSSKIHRDNVSCHLLLRNGISATSRRSLSYKICVPETVAYIVQHRSFCPDDIRVRPFAIDMDFRRNRQ